MAERSALFEGQPLRRRGRSGRAAVAAVAVASTALLYGMGGAPRRGLESLRSSSSYKTDAMPRYSAKIWFDTPIQATDTLSIDVRNYDPYPSADASKAPDRVVLLMDDGTTRTLESNPWDCIYSSADYGSWGRRLFEIDGEMVDQYAVYYDFDQDVLAESFADDDYSGIAGMEFGGDGMQVAYSSIQLYVTNDAVRRRKLKAPSITAYSAATGNLPKRDAPYGGGSTARAASRGGLDPAAHGAESSPWREADTYRMSKYLTSVTVPDGVSGLDTCADTYLYTQSGTLTSETRYGYVSFVVPYVFDASDASETTFQNYDLSYFSISSDYATEYFTVNARMMAALYGTDSKNARGSWGSVFLVPQADWDACTAGTLELCTVDNELEPPHVEVDGEAVGFILPYGNLTIRYRGT
ncbi:hypothetical protein JL722_7133 [Aureococcus anophagefferens]|nr:hypothetical protein JL722_7133 [Aureococcus anophagefferens]